ncbi:hypothetical protein JCM33374_g4155 [Metschnikowia sp. JCM 33374]|nr:hypothetical protein JCM33374_g4155 [Metschnikowia sp. JCM 33374]
MTSNGLCAPTTTIIDFAYAETHPLRRGNFPQSKHSSMASEQDFYDDPQYESYSTDEINSRAVALFDFTPENDNEVALTEGQEIWVSYRHGQGWLVAEDPETGENGLVPEEYVEIFLQEEPEDVPQPFLPHIFQTLPRESEHNDVQSKKKRKQPKESKKSRESNLSEDEEWEDTDDDDSEQPEEQEETSKKPDLSESTEKSGSNSAHGRLRSLESGMENMNVK